MAGWLKAGLLLLCWLPGAVLAGWTVGNNTVVPAGPADTVRLWSATDTGSPPVEILDGRLGETVIGPGNDIYAAGFRDQRDASNSNNASQATLILTRFNPQGGLIWEQSVAVPVGVTVDTGAAVQLSLDGLGRIYLAARVQSGSAPGSDDILIAEYNATGTPVCSQIFDVSGLNDWPTDLVSDAAGATLLATIDINSAGIGMPDPLQDVGLFRIQQGNCSATSLAVYPDPAIDGAGSNPGNDLAAALVQDAAGNLFVLATHNTDANDSNLVMLKYDSLGNRQWKYENTSSNDDTAVAMVEMAGDLYATAVRTPRGGATGSGPGHRTALTIKVRGADGIALASAFHDGSTQPQNGTAPSSKDSPVAIVVEPGDGVYVALQSVALQSSTPDRDVRVIKYDLALQQQLWLSAAYDVGDDDGPLAIAVDIPDEVYVLARQGNLSTGHDIVLLHYEAAGALVDIFAIDNGADERPGGMALGQENGQVIVYVAGGGTSNSFSGIANGSLSMVKFGHARPDLVTQVTSFPANAINEGSIQVAFDVSNLQDSATGRLLDAGAFGVGFYLSPTTAANTLVPMAAGSPYAVAQLASGATTSASITLTLPTAAVLPPGNYYLVAVADDGAVIVEKDETNNRWISPTPIAVIDPPDLTATAVSVSGSTSVAAAATMTVNYTVSNLRLPAAGAFDQSFVLVPLAGGADVSLSGTSPVTALAGLASQSVVANNIVVPAATPVGDYHLGVIVDSLAAIPEADETNNRFVNTAQTITVLPIPDLTVTIADASFGAVVGATAQITTNVQTTASAVTSPFTVSFYLSTDNVITAADTVLGNRVISALTTATIDSLTSTVTIPPATTPGVYYLGAIVDSGAVITESDEANNAAVAAQSISVGLAQGAVGAQPDLYLQSVSAPASIVRGVPFDVTTVLHNTLPEPAAAFDLAIYASTDATVTTADILLATVPFAAGLAGNSSSTDLTSVTVPASIDHLVTWDTTALCGDLLDPNTLSGNLPACGGWPVAGSGSISLESLPADGALEFTLPAIGGFIAFGLSTSSPDHSWKTIDYGIKLGGGTGATDIVENGTVVRRPGVTSGTNIVFRIERVGTQIKYYRNGIRLWTSTVPSSGALFADISLGNNGADGSLVSNMHLFEDLVPPGNYYLGAIADVDNVVTEVNEANNIVVNGGGATQTAIAVVSSSAAQGSAAGAWNGWSLLALLSLCFYRLRGSLSGGWRARLISG